MVDARDAMLAADQIRFNGANQDLLWNAFAKRGLGQGASSNGPNDVDPRPASTSPFADEATVRFRRSTSDGAGRRAKLFVGQYEARVMPIADTDPVDAAHRHVQARARHVRASSRGHRVTAPCGRR